MLANRQSCARAHIMYLTNKINDLRTRKQIIGILIVVVLKSVYILCILMYVAN